MQLFLVFTFAHFFVNAYSIKNNMEKNKFLNSIIKLIQYFTISFFLFLINENNNK